MSASDPSLFSEIFSAITTSSASDDSVFGSLALRLLRHQARSCPFLSRFYAASGCENPGHWTQIPGIPTSAFKRTAIRCFPESETIATFRTSGTTEGESGSHDFSVLSMRFYDSAIVPSFRQHLMPDLQSMPMAILTPPPAEMRHSSLVHMMEIVRARFGTEDSAYYLPHWEPDTDALAGFLDRSIQSQLPVFLLGTAFAFVYVMEQLRADQRTNAHGDECPFPLPAGSRIMETGGFKGRTREIPRPEFYATLSAFFGIPQSMIVNEYGMTELSSQFYDVSIAGGTATDEKAIPSWVRVLCVDPLTGRAMPEGEPGLIRICDLANVGSACVLQTEDVGVAIGDRFRVLGRVGRAPIRGCSLDAEAAMRRA